MLIFRPFRILLNRSNLIPPPPQVLSRINQNFSAKAVEKILNYEDQKIENSSFSGLFYFMFFYLMWLFCWRILWINFEKIFFSTGPTTVYFLTFCSKGLKASASFSGFWFNICFGLIFCPFSWNFFPFLPWRIK